MLRRHTQNLRRGWHIVWFQARNPVHSQSHSHFLQHIAIIIDPGLIHPHAHGHPALLQFHQGQHPGPQTEIRGTVVANTGASAPADLDIFFGHPDTMAQRHVRAQKPELLQMLDCRGASPSIGVLLLKGRL